MASAEFLNKAYLAYFGRPVDPVGLMAFANATEQEVYEAFYASPESRALYGDSFGAEQINAIYNMLFGRDAEPAGLEYWLHQIELGYVTPAGAALSILNGALNEDKVAIQNKLAASADFTDSLDTLDEASAYVGDAAAQFAREWLKTIKTFPASQNQVDDVIVELVDIYGPGVRGPADVYTLTEVYTETTVTSGPQLERVVMWGYNPHAHDETSGVDNLDGNNPDGNDNNLTNEGPEDGGVPIEILFQYIQTVADLDLVQLGLINVANGEDDESTQLFGDVTGMDIVNNGDGTQTITVTLADGTVNTAEVAISQQFFDMIHNWLFDAEGNSRLYEVVRADPNDTGSSTTVRTYEPIVLTTYDNNGGTVEDGVVTGPNDDRIVAGRLELLHGAYIDAGAGYNTLEVDAKGTYAQPKLLENIQKIVVQNMPNVYTVPYGSGDGYLSNSTYPDLSSSGGSNDSVLDITRAVDLERLVITEVLDTGRDLGELTVVGVRGNAVTRFEGAFTEDVNIHYGEGIDGPLTVELVIGQITANLNFAHNTDALHLVSLGGSANSFGTEDLGGRLTNLKISGDAALYINGDLDGSFQDETPITIDASENTKGVDLMLTDSEQVTFLGSLGNDRFQVETDEAGGVVGANGSDDRVTIVDMHGNNHFEVDSSTIDITVGDGDNNIELEGEVATVVAGDGDNNINVDQDASFDAVSVTVGDGNNTINTDDSSVVTIAAGDGNNVISSVRGDSVTVGTGDGDNQVTVSANTISITTGAGDDSIVVSGMGLTPIGDADIFPAATALLNIDTGAGENTVVLGRDVFGSGQFFGITALEGSSIAGENITLHVENPSDLRAAELSGIERVVLNYDIQPTNDAVNPALTLTDVQFIAIGAANFSVEGSVFHTYAQIKIIVTQDTSLTALGVDSLPRNIDLQLEVQDGVTLSMTAEQLHTKVAPNGITLVDDGNTDVVNGDVVITGGGLDFDPFNTSDTVKTVIGGTVYYGGSLSDDFKVDSTWYNVTVSSIVNGYDRPADVPAEVVITLDSGTGLGEITQGAFSTWHTNLEIIGEKDIAFTGAVQMGMLKSGSTYVPTNPFTVDFSQLEAEVKNFTLDNFELLGQGGGIHGNADKGYPSVVHVQLAADEGVSGTAAQSAAENSVGFDEADAQSLVSTGVTKYVVTVIDGPTANGSPGNQATIKLCDTTQDLEVMALRGNYNDTLNIVDAAWGLVFELQGGTTAKADGPTGTANVGALNANYEWDGADAVVNLVHSVAGDTRTIHSAGINIENADSITVNVDGGASIEYVTGQSVEDLVFTATGSVTIVGEFDDGDLESIDASGVVGSFTATVDEPDSGFDFVGGAGGSNLTLLEFEASSSASIDGGVGGAVLTIGNGTAGYSGDDEVDLSAASLSNIDGVVLTQGSELTLTVAQAAEIGAANFSTPGSDTASLNLVGLDGERFVRPEFADDITVAVLSIVNEPEVHLHPETDLTGIGGLEVPEGTTLYMTMAQFQQLNGDGTITGDGSVHITDMTQADVGTNGEDLDMDNVDIGGSLTITLDESVDLSQADLLDSGAKVDTFNVGDDMMLTLGDITTADGVTVNGGANSTLMFTDTTGTMVSIDASGLDVDFMRLSNLLVSGNNVDYMFAGLSERVTKVIYNGIGDVEGKHQEVVVEEGTTIFNDISFNEYQLDAEVTHLTMNLEGGTDLDGDLVLSTVDVNGATVELVPYYLQELVINSTGTGANRITGETANLIRGDITPAAYPAAIGVGSRDNNLKNVTINADQAFMLEGAILFSSHGSDTAAPLNWQPSDGITANDDDAATATLNVTGSAAVTLGDLNTGDDDVDFLVVNHTGTGALTFGLSSLATIDATDGITVNGSATGLDTIVVSGTVNLSDDTLVEVDAIVMNEAPANVTLTVSQAQLDDIGAGNITVQGTGNTSTLNIVELGTDPFDATALDPAIDVVNVTVVSGNVTLNPATNLTGVTEIFVPEGGTLTLTATQFQQLADSGAITAFDANGDLTTGSINVVITGLTQANVDRDLDGDGFGDADDGFDLSGVSTSGGSITVTLGEASVDLGTFDDDGVLIAGSAAVLNGASFELTDNQTLGLVNYTQANGLDVDGGANTTIVFKYMPHTTFPGQVDASGYSVTTLKALAAGFSGGNSNVEYSIDDLPSTVTLRLYEDPSDLGFLDPTFRVVVIESGITTPTGLIFNDWDSTDEVRTLDLTLEGDVTLNGSLSIPTRTDKDGSVIQRYFETLTIHSAGTMPNTIDGNVDTVAIAPAPSTSENNLIDVVIDASQNLAITGDIVFRSVDASDYPAASLTITGTANVTVQQLNVTDPDLSALNIANNGTGVLTVTGSSPAILDNTTTLEVGSASANLETLTFSGTGDIVLGDNDGISTGPGDGDESGINLGNLSVLNASALSGDLSLGEITNIDNESFVFTAGTGVTKMTLTSDTLDVNTPDDTGWTFNFSSAASAAGSEFHLGSSDTTTLSLLDGPLNIALGAYTTLFIDEDMDLSVLGTSLNITGSLPIVLADGVSLTLTAEQANGLNIIAGPDTGAAGITAQVNIVDLGDDPVDLSGIAANIAGTATLEDDDVTLDVATDLGSFSITLEELSGTSGSLAGQTIRMTTVAQADGREIIVDEVISNDDDSSANVVWLFDNITAPVDTADYDPAIGRLWLSTALINNEGGMVESLFTTLPSTILRVDFGTLTELDILLSSSAVDRVMEITNFNTVGNLTFDDIGISPVEHLHSLTLQLGGQVTVGNIAVADVVGAPGYDPASVSFDRITIESFRAVKTGDLLASEGFINDNDGLAESGEHAQPINMNTVGNLGVGADNGLDLLNVYLDTHGVTTIETDGIDGGSMPAGAGAALTVGTITYETDLTGQTARLDITGNNNITIAAVNTADTGISGLTLDATGFTAVLDPVMHMDNTETLTIMNDGGAPEGSDGTVTLQEVEGNELSTINASGFDGTLNITLSQIDSTNDDDNIDGDTLDAGEEAFAFTAGQGVTTMTLETVGANTPQLDTDSEWVFTFTGAAAGSSLTLTDDVIFQTGAILTLVDVPLVIEGDVDLTDVVLSITGGSISVPAGQSLTLTIDQVVALTTAGVDIVGSGTTKIVDDGTDDDRLNLGNAGATAVQTVGVDISGITLDTTLPVPQDADSQFYLTLFADATDDNGDPVGYNVVGSSNNDVIDVDGASPGSSSTIAGKGGDDTVSGSYGDDLYMVESGSDTIDELSNNSSSDDIQVSAGATATATLDDADGTGDFIATALSSNSGTASIDRGALTSDGTIDVSAAGGSNGWSLTGSTDQAASNDTLIGSDQDDVINGGNSVQATGSEDTLTGNGGADRFEFDVTMSSAATLTVATTTAAIDRETITITADGTDDNDETLTVGYTVNGIAGSVAVTLDGTVDVTDASAVAVAVAAAIDSQAGIGATAAAGVVTATGDSGASITITSVVAGGTLTGLAGAIADGTDVAQVSTVTVSGTPTTGDIYSLIASLVIGGGESASYTALALDAASDIATGLEAAFADGVQLAAAVAGSVVTITDQDDDNGGFTVSIDTTAAFGGSGASDNGATSLASADVITDFDSDEGDVISFGMAAGTGANYAEAAAAADFATARANANTAFDGTVQYYLTSSTADTTGLLFFDANLDGDVDGVVALNGITSGSFAASDIVA